MKKTGSIRKVSWPLLVLLAALCTFFPARTLGQSSNRWLLIFETTSSMRHRTNGVLAETQDLLNSGMHGLIHTGDTIGIWTFNDRLYTGEAPLQTWSREAWPKIARHTLQFLTEQQYAKSARMQNMLTNMLNLVDSSPFITVILFTDGDDPIKGTPFDAQINEVYRASYHQQKKASMPIVTIFRGVAGDITTNTVNMAPWPVDIPPVPPPPPPVRAKPRAAAPKPPPPPAVAPLIYIGKKPDAVPPPESGGENNAMPVAPSNTTESNSVAPRSEAPAPPSASATSESPVVSPAAPTVEPMASKPAALAEVPTGEQVSQSIGAVPNQPSAPVAAPAVSPSVAANEPVTTPKNSNAQSTPPANVATAGAPPGDLFSARNIAIVSVAFAVIVCGLLVMAARRARTSQASLITRSLERERK
jgi:hypothetical protein